MPNQPNAEQNPAVPANATAAPELPARVTAARGRILKLVHELKCIHDVVSDEVRSELRSDFADTLMEDYDVEPDIARSIAEKCAIPYDHHSSISAVSGQGEVGARLRSLNKMQWAPAFEKMGISDFIDLRVIAVLHDTPATNFYRLLPMALEVNPNDEDVRVLHKILKDYL